MLRTLEGWDSGAMDWLRNPRYGGSAPASELKILELKTVL